MNDHFFSLCLKNVSKYYDVIIRSNNIVHIIFKHGLLYLFYITRIIISEDLLRTGVVRDKANVCSLAHLQFCYQLFSALWHAKHIVHMNIEMFSETKE